jgi:hypothetical protein
MISYTLDNGSNVGVKQFEVQPTVYLDHWAIRMMSDDLRLQDEFISAVKARNATLMISWLNIGEFTQVTDATSHAKAEQLVERLLPNIFFIEPNPFEVIAKENGLLSGGMPTPSHSDSGLLEEFSSLHCTSLAGFSAKGLFSSMHNSPAKSNLHDLADEIIYRIGLQREELTSNLKLQRAIRKEASGRTLQRGTRYIFRELARTFLVEKKLVLSRNHAIDLIHATVPVAYCDYVLLDAHWEVQVSRLQKRFERSGMEVPLAAVYSKKSEGVSKFLKALVA